MTCGKGGRTRVASGSNCTQPSTKECHAASCMIGENLLSICILYGNLVCDVFRQCKAFS